MMASPLPAQTVRLLGRRAFGSRWAVWAGLGMLAMGAFWMSRRPGTEAAGPGRPSVRFVAGQRLVYQIDLESSSASDFGSLFAEGRSALSHVFEASMKGELAVTVLEADLQHALLAYHLRLENVRFQADGQETPEQSQVIRAALARPVFGLLDGRGRVLSVRFDPATGPPAQHAARTLLAAIQFVGLPPNADPGADWEAEEDDPSGTFVAHYHEHADGTVHKTKLRYLPPKQAKKSKTIVLTPTIESEGEYVATLDAAVHCLIALSAEEAQSVTYQSRLIGQGDLKLEMQLIRNEQSAAAELAALRAAEAELAKTGRAVPLCAARSSEESRLAIQRQELGTATLESLLADLAEAEAASPEVKDATRLFLRFKALAIVRPESCARLGELLTDAEAGSLRMHILADALEAAGHAKAQAALIASIQGRTGDWPALAMLIPVLGSAESPTPETEHALQSLAFGTHDDNVTAAARLALGNVARSLGEESPARAAKIVDLLLLQLAVSRSAESKWQLLLALGNAGSARALPTLTRFLDDTSPELRGAAAWALRWIDSPRADLLLTTKVLSSDRISSVRLEAVRALRFRETTSANFAAQEKALAAEAEAVVRMALLNNLWDARQSNPKARGLVERAAAGDPAPAVREAASKILEGDQTENDRGIGDLSD
jgi:hypothetical protein